MNDHDMRNLQRAEKAWRDVELLANDSRENRGVDNVAALSEALNAAWRASHDYLVYSTQGVRSRLLDKKKRTGGLRYLDLPEHAQVQEAVDALPDLSLCSAVVSQALAWLDATRDELEALDSEKPSTKSIGPVEITLRQLKGSEYQARIAEGAQVTDWRKVRQSSWEMLVSFSEHHYADAIADHKRKLVGDRTHKGDLPELFTFIKAGRGTGRGASGPDKKLRYVLDQRVTVVIPE